MALWIFHLLIIGIASFVAYVILVAVDRKQLAQLVVMVSVMMGLLITMQDLTPTLKRWSDKVDSIHDTADKIAGIGNLNNNIPMKGEITQEFKGDKHHGVDIGAREGTPVYSMWKGDVVKVEWNDIYGNVVIVNHGSGVETLYGHLSGINVKVGYPVIKGSRIGSCGSTGNSTGPHLHWEVRRDGKAVDPIPYLDD